MSSRTGSSIYLIFLLAFIILLKSLQNFDVMVAVSITIAGALRGVNKALEE